MKLPVKVYLGKANKCFCGCSGNWFYSDNLAHKADFDKAVAKFNKLGVDDGDADHDVSNPDKRNMVVALYY
jgi:hypothetical protein